MFCLRQTSSAIAQIAEVACVHAEAFSLPIKEPKKASSFAANREFISGQSGRFGWSAGVEVRNQRAGTNLTQVNGQEGEEEDDPNRLPTFVKAGEARKTSRFIWAPALLIKAPFSTNKDPQIGRQLIRTAIRAPSCADIPRR